MWENKPKRSVGHVWDAIRSNGNLACIFALAVDKLRIDPDVTESERVTSCASRAEALLREALMRLPESERLAFWRDKVEPDHALDAIRSTPAFEALRKEFAGVYP